MKHRGSAMSLSLVLVLVNPVSALEIGGEVAVATDYVFRGVSQTMSGGALQAAVTVEGDSGWFGYVWASNVDFTPDGAAGDGARLEVDVGGGYAWQAAERLTLSLCATRFVYPDTLPGVDYDYTEYEAGLTLDERHTLKLAYSGNALGAGFESFFYSVGTGTELTDFVDIGVEAGLYDLTDGFGSAYGFAAIALSGSVRSLDWQLSYVTTSDEAGDVFHESTTGDRLVLALTLPF